MSMYNMLFGRNPCAEVLLSMLGLTEEDVGRYRDCFTNEDGSQIIVHTRNGGGNRDDYSEVMDRLAKHPCYLSDADEDFDCTYADIVFRVPEPFADAVKAIADQTDTTPPAEKWKKILSDLDSKKDNAQVSRALDICRKIFSAIETSDPKTEVKTPDGGIIVQKFDPES